MYSLSRVFIFISLSLICAVAPFVHGQNLSGIEQKLQTITDPAAQLDFLLSRQSEISAFDRQQQAQYWFLLGSSQEKNKQLEQALASFSEAVRLSQAYHQGPSVLLVESLLERAYVRYLQTYDTRLYCPDRKLALEQARQLGNKPLLVKVLVRYAFCFKDFNADLPRGLALLDEAIAIATHSQLSPREHAMIYNASGLLYKNYHVYEKSYDFLNKAYQQWASVNDYQDMFNMQFSLVDTAIDMKRFDLAAKHVDTLFYLAKNQKQFNDFSFFSHLSAGYLAYSQGKFKESVAQLQLALEQSDKTGEVYFIRRVHTFLIINYFRLGKFSESQEQLATYRSAFPGHEIDSAEILAISAFLDGKHSHAMEQFYRHLDQEVDKRRDFVLRSTSTTASLFNVNITELDNKILQQELEINALKFDKEQEQKRNAYLFLVLVSFLAFALILLSWHLLRTRKTFRYRAQTDHLTRIANRRHSFEQGQLMLNQAQALRQPLSLIVFDIDHFKLVNDTLGHEMGDQAIIQVVAKTKECLRKQDHLGRIGGEEFLLLLPETPGEQAVEIAERIRAKVATSRIGEEPNLIHLSVSLGVVCADGEKNLQALINRGDKALYQAKAEGRNRAVMA
ncbi:GGDEF domain-containing protein [Thalassomonas viridans]|uniref:diguanylate cyclase n=1 Tax=Thalassomonas viridans TaxID=137584 RepID=A0AAF0CA51_9GAMM|nr:GGDEF domain-containing protein [Thalassomonas viridans]WDE05925.1 GGDEF domain-containing protein [Thalassomonas viridans]